MEGKRPHICSWMGSWIAAVSLAVPSAFNRLFFPQGAMPKEALLNPCTAIALLATRALN
jgi:hypothetical protein